MGEKVCYEFVSGPYTSICHFCKEYTGCNLVKVDTPCNSDDHFLVCKECLLIATAMTTAKAEEE